MSNEIVYSYKDNAYLNITNKCPCACTFCIRNQKDAIGSANSLWLEHNPTFEEVKTALDNYNLDNCKEIIFCGYGEPTNSYDVLIETAKYIRENYKIKTRINTNGLGNLINNKNIKNFEAANFASDNIFGGLFYGPGLKAGATYYVMPYVTYSDNVTLYAPSAVSFTMPN